MVKRGSLVLALFPSAWGICEYLTNGVFGGFPLLYKKLRGSSASLGCKYALGDLLHARGNLAMHEAGTLLAAWAPPGALLPPDERASLVLK